jgi:hypothetical protein
MTNHSDKTRRPDGATQGDNSRPGTRGAPQPSGAGHAGSRDDRLDEELNRERLEPGLDAEGSGGAGARPAKPSKRNT